METLRGFVAGRLRRNVTLSVHGGFGVPAPWGGMTENLNGLIHPPVAGPAPVQDLTSILGDPAQHFQLDLDQAPQAIAAFRQVAQGMRDLMDQAERLGNVPAPGPDGVSINAVKEIGQWANSEEPGSRGGRWRRAHSNWRRPRRRWSGH